MFIIKSFWGSSNVLLLHIIKVYRICLSNFDVFFSLNWLCWELLIVCGRISFIFYCFRDSLDRKWQKSANFHIWKLKKKIHPILSAIFCKMFPFRTVVVGPLTMAFFFSSFFFKGSKGIYKLFFLSNFDVFSSLNWLWWELS